MLALVGRWGRERRAKGTSGSRWRMRRTDRRGCLSCVELTWRKNPERSDKGSVNICRLFLKGQSCKNDIRTLITKRVLLQNRNESIFYNFSPSSHPMCIDFVWLKEISHIHLKWIEGWVKRPTFSFWGNYPLKYKRKSWPSLCISFYLVYRHTRLQSLSTF